jgi:hypothetical protein
VTDGGQLLAGMGFLLLAVAITAVAGVLLAAGIGYWCMRVFESRGRPGGWGFLLGFALTFFLSVAGAVAAVVIAYLWEDPVAQPVLPLATGYGPSSWPPAPGPEALTVATFGPSTGWWGRRILFDRGALQVEGVATVLPRHVQDYVRSGQADWASGAMRDWIAQWAARG